MYAALHHTHFNPRSREGSELVGVGEDFLIGAISIHAPVKESDNSQQHTETNSTNFNPRSREGATRERHK